MTTATPLYAAPSNNGPPAPSEMAPSPRGGGVTKVEKYGWVIKDQPGQFQWLPKAMLQIDHEYQRTRVSNPRVLAIAAEWSWLALGVLCVGRRPDGSLWVMDGQHRKLAADKRADINMLPCLIYDVENRGQEAKSFLDVNTRRGPVTTLDRYNAMLISGDQYAIQAKTLVEADGYKFSNSTVDFGVKCVGTIMRALKANPKAALVAWKLCVDLCGGKQVPEFLFAGLFGVEQHLGRKDMGTLCDANNRQALIRVGVDAIRRSCQDARAYHGGGMKSDAEGIVRLLNKGRRTRRLPSIQTDGVSELETEE